jgi:hypothetical protein
VLVGSSSSVAGMIATMDPSFDFRMGWMLPVVLDIDGRAVCIERLLNPEKLVLLDDSFARSLGLSPTVVEIEGRYVCIERRRKPDNPLVRVPTRLLGVPGRVPTSPSPTTVLDTDALGVCVGRCLKAECKNSRVGVGNLIVGDGGSTTRVGNFGLIIASTALTAVAVVKPLLPIRSPDDPYL